VNPLNRPAGSQGSLTAAELHQLGKGPLMIRNDPALKSKPDMQLIFAYDFYDIDNPSFNVHGLYGLDQGRIICDQE